MIYTNFLLFIAAIILFSMAPLGSEASKEALFSTPHLLGIIMVVLVFWHFNRNRFLKLRTALQRGEVSTAEAKKTYLHLTNIHMIFALFAFAAEIFIFDLKFFLTQIPLLGRFESSLNILGIAIFVLHLSIIWYWAYQAMGDVIFMGKSAAHHVKANIKFNLVIVIPWLALLVLMDIIMVFSTPAMILAISSPLAQLVLFGTLVALLAIFTPFFITWLWECKPLQDKELKDRIADFCRSQGVKFKKIMSWNALNGGLVTAGVLGLIAPFRYLLITPELMNLLDEDELMAVVSHEVGHVKKKHLVYYLMFLLAFMLISVSIFQLTTYHTPLDWTVVVQGGETAGSEVVSNILSTAIFLLLFVLYFRFIFGYFMRNFEREADIFCFKAGINPSFMISSFEKLEQHMGGDSKKSNWHHYTIPQRVGFLKTCLDDPRQIRTHEKKVKRGLRVFLVSLLVLIVSSSYLFLTSPTNPLQALQKQIEQDPANPVLYRVLGEFYYALEQWEKAKEAYENSLHLNYRQPGVLNGLAWLLLTCPEEKLLNARQALKYAQDAAALDEKSFHILDTLAEAYFQNSMYKEALLAAQKAYQMATEDHAYYEKQLKKMAKYYHQFKSTIRI
jgi:Zn-dependent protease with chaperone function